MNKRIKAEVNEVGDLPPGNYYLGDPCYVIADELWDEFCDKLSSPTEDNLCTDGIIFEFRGHKVFVSSTNCGDGCYRDNLKNSYSVDAGIIGLIPIELCVKRTADQWSDLGARYEAYDSPITCRVTRGRWIDKKKIYIGSRVITT